MMTTMGQMDAEQLGQLMGQLEQMAGQAPPENQDMTAVLLEIVRERRAAAGGGR